MTLQAQEQAQYGFDARVDYEALHRKTRQRRAEHKQAEQQQQQRREAAGEHSHSSRYAHKSSRDLESSPTDEDSGRESRRKFGSLAQTDAGDDEHHDNDRRERSRSLPREQLRGSDSRDEHEDSHAERPKTAMSRGQGSTSSSASTPHSSTSEYPRHAFSTTATSVTPGRSSMHEAKLEFAAAEREALRKEAVSRNTFHDREPISRDPQSRTQSRNEVHNEVHTEVQTIEPALERAPDSAIECSATDIEGRRRGTMDSERDWDRLPQDASTRSTRSNSRVRNFAEGISDYFRPPGRRVLSRQTSRESMRRSNDEPRRSGSSTGWRTWGGGRKENSLDIDRSGLVQGFDDYRGREQYRYEVNLNRALPPLPGLDQWEASQKGGDKKKKKGETKLMRPRVAPCVKLAPENDVIQDPIDEEHESEVEDFTARRPEQRDSGMSNTKTQSSSLDDSSARSSVLNSPNFTMNKNLSSQFVGTPATDSLSPRTRTPGPVPSADAVKARASAHRRQVSESSVSAPNFSRKISIDNACARMADAKYPNAVKLKSEDKKGLRRVISAWFNKKESNWMDRVEKEGAKGGLILATEKKSSTGAPPVVRY